MAKVSTCWKLGCSAHPGPSVRRELGDVPHGSRPAGATVPSLLELACLGKISPDGCAAKCHQVMAVLTKQLRLLIGEDLVEDVVASLSFQLESDS